MEDINSHAHDIADGGGLTPPLRDVTPAPSDDRSSLHSAQGQDHDEDGAEDLFGDEVVGEGAKDDTEMADLTQELNQEGMMVDEDGNELSEDEIKKRKELEYLEVDQDVDIIERKEVIAEADLNNLPMPDPSDGKHWDFRIPAFLEISSQAFTEANLDEEEDYDATVALPDENIIRWRWNYDDQQNLVRQSNARIVKWSDGSQSLQVGSELFDLIYSIDQSATLPSKIPSQTTSTSKTAAKLPTSVTTTQMENPLTFLFVQHFYARLIEGQGSMTGTIAVRPSGVSSNTHKILAARAQLKHKSVGRSRRTMLTTTSVDPELAKLAKEAEEMKKVKDAKRIAKKIGAGGTGGGRGNRSRKFNARLLDDEGEEGYGDQDAEGDFDDDTIQTGRNSGSNVRRNPRRGTGGVYGAVEDDGFVVPDSEQGSDDDEDGDESDGRGKTKLARPSPSKKQRVTDGLEPDPNAPLDDLEAAEQKLERQAKQDRKHTKDGGATEVGNTAAGRRRMVIESDDDE